MKTLKCTYQHAQCLVTTSFSVRVHPHCRLCVFQCVMGHRLNLGPAPLGLTDRQQSDCEVAPLGRTERLPNRRRATCWCLAQKT